MKLKTLIKGLNLTVKGSKEVEVTGLAADSRKVAPGNLFFAKRGTASDGTQFISQAVSAGAAVIATDIYDPFLEKPQIIHPNVAELEAKLAARYYGQPADELFVVGVTGTKGKTTTTYLIKHLLDHLARPAGLIGTVETILGESRFDSTLTTHDPISNHKWLREMVNQKRSAAVLEVSSHGLSQGRVDEIAFDWAIFTNLYSDHLDYHKTIEAYAAEKRKLFQRAEQSILNADNPWSSFMGQGFTFGIEKGELRPSDIRLGPHQTQFRIGETPFTLPLIGRFNVYNALAAIALGVQLGVKLDRLSEIFASFTSVPARLERIGNVFIDFAHTGEALEGALQTLKEISPGRVIVVFGCGGNRDPGRRSAMGKAAEKWADLSIITSDNPRQEDPHQIASHICAAFKKPPLVELDRHKAIEMALRMAKPEDFVLIAGKGHEKVQIFAHQTIPFDDAAVVRKILHLC